ncbi:putative porin [Aliifodinibius sp. S!AR15-10]|uniref:putative porin n=1 Tax=Aliifodinibius sp. S!AR15-10 TaxID=2950437 RepID=UPI00285C6273|nr:putative porin [Aliifodinibius sp. S!AR15-10]MDR8390290.1 putative porin [Aliifodinibius sp. S!AR15-10]
MSRRSSTYLTLLLILFAFGITNGYAQVDPVPVDTVQISVDTTRINLQEARADTVFIDTTAADTAAKPIIDIIPWIYNQGISAQMATNDSLMRWQNWPVWTSKKNRDPGVISFRLGTVGRSSSLMIDAHDPRYQELFWEDIPLHNRVSGTVNWNVIPIHKLESIYEEGEGLTHETNFFLKNHYVNQPLTRLIFDESKYNRRALEFWITQNFTQKTNAELSYWDRRGGGGYNNSSFTGNQIFAKVYHQYDNQQFFKVRFLNGSRSLGEPFGYTIPDLSNFAFNRFNTPAIQSSATSESGFTTVALSYHRRPADSTAKPERFRGGLFMNNQKREVAYSADTTYYKLNSVGVFAHKWIELDPFKVEGELRYELLSSKEPARSSLEGDNWGQLSTSGTASFQPLSWAKLEGNARFKKRGEQSSYSFGADLELMLANRLKLSGGASRGTKIPTLQQLYWNSAEYMGNPGLDSEKIMEAHGNLEYEMLFGLNFGTRAQLKQVNDGVFLNSQNQFININQYQAVSATGYMDFEKTHWELSASGTVQQYQNALPDPATSVPAFNTTRVWLKGSAYWKGYLFNRATYVKAGLAGMFSPFQYQAEHYDTALDYWQPASTDQELPWYSRLDLDVSARIRSIMVVLRYENVLDEVSQLGYFETANYPMPPRRFLFGVRARFNN